MPSDITIERVISVIQTDENYATPAVIKDAKIARVIRDDAVLQAIKDRLWKLEWTYERETAQAREVLEKASNKKRAAHKAIAALFENGAFDSATVVEKLKCI